MEPKETPVKHGTEWSSLTRKEDWLVVWIGFTLFILTALGLLNWMPKIAAWSTSIIDAFKPSDLPYYALLAVLLLALTSTAIKSMGSSLAPYWKGFPMVFLVAFVSFIIAKQQTISYYGLEYVIWALLLGLIASNLFGTPNWLKPAIKTELFTKTGLVLLGAEILFPTIVKGGAISLLEAIITVLTTWYFCYFLAQRTGLSKSFACIMASGVSICGVSAAIAAGGAIKGDKKEVSYTISMVLLTSVVMLIGEPVIARLLNLPSAVAGAWMGGTIDTTGAVVAAGALYSEVAMTAAAIVKLTRNMLIGVVAFMLALYWTLKVNANPEEKPKITDIWYRFPKFIVGFITTSLIFSFILTPSLGETRVKTITTITEVIRGWFFSLAFVSIGLETRFRDLLEVGGKKAALVFLTSQALNIGLVYCLAWLLFGNIFFPSPI